jgi:hypothetical protein
MRCRLSAFAWCAVCTVALLLSLGSAGAKVFYAKDEALRLAFPDAEQIEARDVFLTVEQRAAIEGVAKSKLDSDLLTIYVGKRAGAVQGYALLDTHNVRTLPETFLIVLSPQGAVTATHLLAFYEPLEYSPPDRWLKQFDGATLDDRLRIGGDIATITGSTLTSEAVTGGVRRALAIYDVLLKGH